MELVVLSDANTFFISTILEQKKLDHFFSTIISNCGQFDEEVYFYLFLFIFIYFYLFLFFLFIFIYFIYFYLFLFII